ncbi:PDZ and LIM domain protein 3 [Papilio xuthus]|uniref:PDZ and LIM domain protein 3 n=1 Tax=Papilio xuthus TaxID=66420 RepID=A0A194PF96_PAPXU|nr:PDZ and LIM domain protein 3 [Papilio xuthus]
MTTKEVELTGGAPWGFRMHGGADHNQPLRISRVNPGRKASLSGIREGDVISSINGQPTRTMSNADAHAMLRSAGPVLRLGLNEDKEMSPRRRSIGRASDLKRSSHLLSEINNDVAIPQAPVYATIRPAKTSQHRPQLQQPSSLSSLPAALNTNDPVKSMTPKEETIQFHPTNPFYTTLPSNYSSASKLPVPNGRASLSGLDRSRSQNKFKDNLIQNEHESDLRSPSYFSLMNDSGPHSTIFSNYNDTGNTNGYNSETLKLPRSNKDSPFVRDSNLKIHEPSSEIKFNEKNPFKMKRNSDPFDKFLRSNGRKDENRHENSTIPISISDSDLHKNEQEMNHISVTEHKVSETEEIKTIKKIIMNGSSDKDIKNLTLDSKKINHRIKDESPATEHYIKVQYSPQNEHVNGKSTVNTNNYEASYDKYRNEFTISTENQPQDKHGNIIQSVIMNSPCFASAPYIFHPVSESSATESDDSTDSGQDTIVGGTRTKYNDPKHRTINKVSKKILKAIEKLTCNLKKKTKKYTNSENVKDFKRDEKRINWNIIRLAGRANDIVRKRFS